MDSTIIDELSASVDPCTIRTESVDQAVSILPEAISEPKPDTHDLLRLDTVTRQDSTILPIST